MKFICDVMLGKLAKYLRIAGIDAVYSHTINKPQLIKTAKQEERIILTRSRDISKNDTAACFVIQSNYPSEQLIEVISHYQLSFDRALFFTRCLLCNQALLSVEKQLITGQVPDYVFTTIDHFSQCPECKKIYWKGTHYNNMLRMVDVLLGNTIKIDNV